MPQALLWRIEGKESKEPSYLFGTIHLIPKSDFFLPVGFDEAFDHCDQVVFEIDMDDMSDMNALMGMLGNIVMKDNMTLKKLLTPEEYKEVSDYFEGMGLPMFLLNKVKPMFLSMLAEVNMDPSTMGNDDIVSYETDIYEKANERKKEVGGLETMAYQMSLFDSIPYTDQAKMLVDAVRSTNQGSDSLDETLAL
ncbi:MAG TPA: TraB/GumN family protein, partial [Saprospiraceae bacterium]|nr:TraB/GumN family protein [Saprospiraceae bacterium]